MIYSSNKIKSIIKAKLPLIRKKYYVGVLLHEYKARTEWSCIDDVGYSRAEAPWNDVS